MALVSLSPPISGIYHLTRRFRQPFTPPEWKFAGHERFDDPSLEHDNQPVDSDAFRVIYTASDRRAAIRESIAHFRPSLSFLATLKHDVIDQQWTAQESLVGNYDIQNGRIRGIVPRSWIANRHIGHAHLDQQYHFADVTATSSLSYLRTIPEITAIAIENGIQDIDVSAITGNCRPVTQACARHIRGLVTEQGTPEFTGIRYISRYGSEHSWECWAIFEDRLELNSPVDIQQIDKDDPDLQEVLLAFDLVLEST